MWIKVALCTIDIEYAQKLNFIFDKEYADKAEINIFDNIDTMLDYIKKYDTDLVLFGEEFVEEANDLVSGIHCICGFLVKQLYESTETAGIAIAKYQRSDNLYKSMLDAYSRGEHVKQISHNALADKKNKIYMFVSPNGGTGTTTIARAFAKKCALFEKVLYLDMSLINCNIDRGENHGFDEIIMALKSRRNILPIKLVSAVSTDKDKIDTYAACKNPIDILEITREDVRQLFEQIEGSAIYQKVIVDVGSYITGKEMELFKLADEIVCVVGNRSISRIKYRKFMEILDAFERSEGIKVMRKVTLFKNMSGRNGFTEWAEMGCRDAGWAPDVHIDDYEACIDKIAQSDAFDILMH